MVLPIVKGVDNKVLRTKSLPVKKTDKKLKKLIADMTDTLLDCDGLGIAAPQVGVNLRIYVARLNFQTSNETIVPMINAEIINFSKETELGEEGCLSVPKRYGLIKRFESVTVKYMDAKGQRHVLKLEGLNARLMQHEIDHLDGILIVDKMEKEVLPEERSKREIEI